MWRDWIKANFAELRRGSKLEAPWWLGAPSKEGFQKIQVASPLGQSADWGLSLSDGSRIHIHEFTDGRRLVHRDKYDPVQGVGNTVAHIFIETGVGIILLIACIVKAASSK